MASKRTSRLFSTSNNSIRLAKRPVGLPNPENWQFTSEPLSKVEESGIVVKVSTISLDPAMRGWMNEGKSYIRPVEIGEVMRASGIGTVIESKNPKFGVGTTVAGGFGVQEHAVLSPVDIKRNGVHAIDMGMGSDTQWLNVLGMPGMTGYFGLNDIGKPQPGETIVISAAAGAVGQTVGQLAKIYGLRVVGIAGGKEKCDWVVNTLGYDACVDYKDPAQSVHKGLKAHCPDGVDIYFDNVGGDILDTVLTRINRKARIIICGAISQYNAAPLTGGVSGPKNYLSLLVNRAKMEGMVVFDYSDRYHLAIAEMSGYLKNGQMTSREHVVRGLENFPESLNFLFSGQNFGKLVLRV